MASLQREAGDTVGGYRVVARLGVGGSGSVYRVTDDAGHECALKLVDAREDQVAAARLRREVHALQSLRHPAVPRVLDAELDEDATFVVFELVDGETLFDFIQRHGPLAGEELADFAAQTSSALTAVHTAGVIHRDVTPSNIMMGADGPMLIDFGLAHRRDDARLTQDGLVSGTPGYVAPEVIDGAEPGPAADRWAWAASVAYAMTGEAPFGSGTGAIGRTLEGRVSLPDVPGAAALAAALGRDKDARPAMADVVAALRGATVALPQLAATAVAPVGWVNDAEATAVLPVSDDNGADVECGEWAGAAWSEPEWDESPEPQPVAGDDAPPPVPMPPRRRGMLLLGGAVLVAAAPLAPVPVWLAMVAIGIVARGVYRRAAAIAGARTRRGAPRTADSVVHTLGLPWHTLRGAAESVPAIILSAVAGVGAGALLWWLASTGTIAPLTETGQYLGHAGALMGGALAAVLVLAFGPYMRGTREGAHRIAAVLSPSTGVRTAWILLALAGALVACIAIYVRVEPWWWPLPGPPAAQ